MKCFVNVKGLCYAVRMSDIDFQRDYLTIPQAAKHSGFTPSYLAHLLRTGRLEGFRLAREWFLYTDSLEVFLSHPRKPGPKGPRGGKDKG